MRQQMLKGLLSAKLSCKTLYISSDPWGTSVPALDVPIGGSCSSTGSAVAAVAYGCSCHEHFVECRLRRASVRLLARWSSNSRCESKGWPPAAAQGKRWGAGGCSCCMALQRSSPCGAAPSFHLHKRLIGQHDGQKELAEGPADGVGRAVYRKPSGAESDAALRLPPASTKYLTMLPVGVLRLLQEAIRRREDGWYAVPGWLSQSGI
ncbi:hypothetical protein COO60DRAFT_795704 [Scenedesmus sp. NREL 46B-D3]|nr:hypothetical protein COO60DRAFT_795704 [Scenedesmus sp. NREL 46B-D3]